MAEPKKGWLPRIEILIILVFLISFIVWATSKCSATKDDYNQTAQVDNTTIADTTSTASADGIKLPKLPQKEVPQDTIIGAKAPQSNYSRLYVTIDGLKMRKAPNLKSEVIMQLPLFEEVQFMNEVTDSTTELSLGKVMANEPWVKIKHKKGREGWVYGAGVNYYKKKTEGVE